MQKHKKIIVCTTINAPTEAIKKFDNLEGWHLVVVGDLKTPTDFRLQNGTYLSPSDQEKMFPQMSSILGWNCIQRRNIGFLYALKSEAAIVATVDDDNIPTEHWGENLIVGQTTSIKNYEGKKGVFDPIAVTNYPHLWHRGFPLQYLAERNYINSAKKEIQFDVEASFWNGDPDIDAICRMEHAPICTFDEKDFPFSSDAISPFNSQNTFLTSDVLRSYFMFIEVGRMDDIWASYYVQALGYKVAYSKPSVRQERNIHDLTVDFQKEVIGYTNNHKLLLSIMENPENLQAFVGEKSWNAFCIYREIACAV